MQILVIKGLSYNFPILDCFWTLGPLGLGSHLGLSNICYWFCINLGFFLMALGPLGSQPLALKALSPWMEYIVCFLRTLCILGLWTLDLWSLGTLLSILFSMTLDNLTFGHSSLLGILVLFNKENKNVITYCQSYRLSQMPSLYDVFTGFKKFQL